MLGDFRLERAGAGVGFGGWAGEVDVNDGTVVRGDLDRRAGSGLFQCREGAIDPLVGRGLVVQVALDAIRHARGAQGLQPFIEAAPDLAELGVGAVTEGEHGKA